MQALGVVGYCALVGMLFWKGQELFGKMDQYWGPVLFLLIFSVSALVCGLLVFYQPYRLFMLEKKREEAAKLVLYTTGWLLGLVVAGLLIVIVMRVV